VSEFLVDGDLALEDCSEFDFVGHNPDFCSLKSCSEKGTRLHDAMAQTMAFVFGCEIRSLDPILRREPRYRKDKRLADAVGDGLAHVYTLLTRTQKKPDGTINDPETAIAMVRGALALFGTGQISRARDIVWNLKNNDVLYQALESIVKQHFDIENWHLVEN
jgi:hypothetical protein